MGLRAKLLLPVLAAFVLLSGIVHLYWTHDFAKDRNEFLHYHHELLRALQPELVYNLLQGDLGALYATLDWSMNRHPEWRQLVLRNAAGERIYPLQEPPSLTGDDNLLLQEYALSFNDDYLGDLRLTLDWGGRYAEKRAEILLLELSALLICGVLGSAIWFAQERLVRRPLLHLKQAAARLAEHDFTARLPDAGRDEVGELTRAFAAMRNNLLHARQALQTSDTRHRIVAELTADCAYVQRVTAGGELRTEWHSGHLPGTDGQDAPPAAWEQRLHPDDRALLQAQRQALLAGRERVEDYRIVDHRQRLYWVRHYARPFREPEDGPVRLIYGAIQDITARKQAEEALRLAKDSAEKANRAKSVFLANMSHEIRTPLNAILGFSELLYNQVEDPRHKSYLEAVRNGGRNLLVLINDILDLSKIEAGHMELRPEPVDLSALFQEIGQIFSLRVQEKGLSLETSVDPELGHGLLLDTLRLRQVLLNLVGNAVKFTETGFVRLSAEVEQAPAPGAADMLDLLICVEDSGKGIVPEAQGQIFEPFKQQDEEDSRKYGGTGLGLNICKRLVEMMQGSIGVVSAPGQGSRFEVRLRRVGIAAVLPPAPADAPIPTRFAPASVLVVDDLDINRQLVGATFADSGLHILEADSGQAALRCAAQYRPAAILMDLRMPGMDGYETTRRLKADPALRAIPVIALTASVLYGEQDKLRDAGFDGFLQKPVQAASLYRELARFLALAPGPAADGARPPPALSAAGRAALPGVLAELQTRYRAEWEKVRKSRLFPQIEAFARDLACLGEAHDLLDLTEFGKTLLGHVQSFDIARIENDLQAYPRLLEHLQAYSNTAP